MCFASAWAAIVVLEGRCSDGDAFGRGKRVDHDEAPELVDECFSFVCQNLCETKINEKESACVQRDMQDYEHRATYRFDLFHEGSSTRSILQRFDDDRHQLVHLLA